MGEASRNIGSKTCRSWGAKIKIFVSLLGKSKDAPKAMVKTLGATKVQHPGHPFRSCFEPRESGTRSEVGTALAGVWHAEGVRHLKTGAADLHGGSTGDKQVRNRQQNSRLELISSSFYKASKKHEVRSLVCLGVFFVFFFFWSVCTVQAGPCIWIKKST